MKDPSIKKILSSPDLDEITSKLIIGISAKDIHEWLAAKYTAKDESNFILSEKLLKTYQDKYLDFHVALKEDLAKTSASVKSNIDLSKELELNVKNNSSYKDALTKLANNELDIKSMLLTMIVNIETRTAQVFDQIQDNPETIKADRVLMEWFDRLGTMLEKYHKLVIEPPQLAAANTTNNITFNMIDQSATVFYEALRETLSEIDVESSLLFMEKFHDKMNKVKELSTAVQSTEERYIEAQLLTESISSKL